MSYGAGYASGGPAMPGAGRPTAKVELRISCQNLTDKDVTSKSDPLIALLEYNNKKWVEVDRTDHIKNSLNPNFSKPFLLDYFFEEVQKLKFAVYDIDNISSQLSDDDFLGEIECTLGQIVSSKPYVKPLLWKSGKPAGKSTITILAEEMSGSNQTLMLSFRAHKLENKDTFGKSDPFLEILKPGPSGVWILVHRTEVVKNNLSPSWKEFKIGLQSLCGGNMEQQIKITCNDWDSDGSHDLIGEFFTTTQQLMSGGGRPVEWECINPKKKAKKKSYKNSGTVFLTDYQEGRNYSFLDYIFGGCQINFVVGIDFTGSNGAPTDPKSLHYLNSHYPNEYMQAIMAVGHVVQDYDSDKLFPALGFGAKIPPSGEISHEFAINFNMSNPFCAGVEGILAAYQSCIHQVKLWGPTNFTPLINHAMRFATEATKDGRASNYYVLLILTDGVITDMDETREAIVQASALPMSIIIVGVGNADFTMMNILDGDDGVLKSPRGQPVFRDIVQFVPYRDFKQATPEALAKCVLAEVPGQVTKYFESKHIPPNNQTIKPI